MKAWLWVLLCALGIYSAIPLARSLQELIYKSVGKEFFTYLVFFVIAAGLITLLYIFIFKLRIKSISQYIYIIICSGIYVYFTIQLGANPEEAIHIIEYGLLSFFVFRALSYRIKDWTIYITAAFLVMLFGTADELLQWIMPTRYWDYRDVGINFLGGAIFLLVIWKGIKPSYISGPVRGYSVRILVCAITLNLILMGFCLSNTPDNVKRYTSDIGFLSWLQQEESMTGYGHNHYDPEIGYFNSRFELDEIESIDTADGSTYGKIISDDINSGLSDDDMLKKYGPASNPYLYEFLLHHYRRVDKTVEFHSSSDSHDKSEIANAALKENILLNRYFKNTLLNSGLKWPQGNTDSIKEAALPWNDIYVSNTGKMITSFDINTARAAILISLFFIWVLGEIWKRKLNGD